jgi:flagellar hook protein FlgE
VQGWTANKDGVVNASAKPDDIRMPLGATIPPKETTAITLKGNLSSDVNPDPNNPLDVGELYTTTIPIKVYDESGSTKTVVAHLTRVDNVLADSGVTPTSAWKIHMPYEEGVTDTTTGGDDLFFSNGRPVVDRTASPVVPVTSLPIAGYTVDLSDITSFSGISDARVFDTDGQTAGALASLSYSVSDTGQIVGVYSNGLKQVLGQVAMATFKNPTGLEKIGDSSFRSSVNSGYAQVGTPGSAGMGSVVTGALEMSNVDLSQEFTNLIIAQRGFQANSRILTTSDELLQELVNMKR